MDVSTTYVMICVNVFQREVCQFGTKLKPKPKLSYVRWQEMVLFRMDPLMTKPNRIKKHHKIYKIKLVSRDLPAYVHFRIMFMKTYPYSVINLTTVPVKLFQCLDDFEKNITDLDPTCGFEEWASFCVKQMRQKSESGHNYAPILIDTIMERCQWHYWLLTCSLHHTFHKILPM